MRRTGHTEAAVDLAKLAGYEPAGVLVEILNEDGTMARLPQLLEISRKHNLKIISIKDLVEYRMRNERLVKEVFRKTYRSPAGDIDIHGFEQITTGDFTFGSEIWQLGRKRGRFGACALRQGNW